MNFLVHLIDRQPGGRRSSNLEGMLDQIGLNVLISHSSRIRGLRLAADEFGSAGHGLAAGSVFSTDILKLDKSIIDVLLDGAVLPIIEALAKMSKAANPTLKL